MRVISGQEMAEHWRGWCGDTPWSAWMQAWGELGGGVVDMGGMPQSASAITLTFTLLRPTGEPVPGHSRLHDVREAVFAEHRKRGGWADEDDAKVRRNITDSVLADLKREKAKWAVA